MPGNVANAGHQCCSICRVPIGPFPPNRQAKPPTILVVDDSPDLLDLVRESLEDEGYVVVTCLQSREALRLAHETSPDAIMLDVVMPELSGWELLAQVRADPAFGSTPVIICTGYVDEALGRLAELQGPRRDRHLGLLPKPFDTDELIEVVASVMAATRPSAGSPAHRA